MMHRELIPAPALLGRSSGNIKTHNVRAVLLTLLHHGPVSRVRMAQLTGLSTTTITNLITELLDLGLVAETGKEEAPEGRNGNGRPGAGRPPTLVTIVPAARCAVGVHIGVDTLRVGVTDLFGNLRDYRVISHTTDASVSEVLAQATHLVETSLTAAAVDRRSLVGVGVGASGLVDPEQGVNLLAPNLGWRDAPVRELLGRALGLPVIVDNNVRAMALAEAMFGAGRGVNALAFVYGRVGVGAGFVVSGDVYRGSRAGAGEIGHTTMIPAGGAPCRCGNTGCLETLVSEQEIIRQAQVLAARAPDSILAAKLTADRRPPTAVDTDGRPSSVVGQAGADETPDTPIERILAAKLTADRRPLTAVDTDGRSSSVVRHPSSVVGQVGADETPDTPIERIFAAARAGDHDTQTMLDERAFYIGTALANLVNLINPDMIILGGMFAAGADLLLPRIEETMRRRSFAGLGNSVALRVTTFGRKVGVVGAAALALDAFFYRQTPAVEFAG